MNSIIKTVLIGLFVIVILILLGYYGMKVYNYAVDDATKRIKQGVTEGVKEGVGEGIGSSMNPLGWPKKMFGGR